MGDRLDRIRRNYDGFDGRLVGDQRPGGLFNSEFYVVTLRWIFQFDISTWAWIHLILGIIILVAGFFLFTGATWARVVGVIMAILAGLAAFAWLPYYPVWAILFIAMSIGVIWALTAHGRDITMA